MRSAIKDYLSITKKEWNGLVVLVILIVIALIVPYLYKYFHKEDPINLITFNAEVAKLKASGNNKVADVNKPKIPFKFNPNNITDNDWEKLGLTSRQISIIKNYQAKGGHFYHRQDLKKIYGITNDDYGRLAPYINLPGAASGFSKPIGVIELNSADAKQLEQLNGIGPAFAVRIIRYRDRLGGFYNKQQLKEVFGIDSMLYSDIEKHLRVDSRRIIKIDLNTATMNSLMAFPYLSYKQKNAVIEYRNQHGDYTTLADLKNIPIIDDVILRKIEPYVSLK